MSEPGVLWTAQTKNSKTGNVPTAWIGTSVEESKETCFGCPLLESKVCYAHNGSPAMGFFSLLRSVRKRGVQHYNLDKALEGRWFGAKMVRLSAIGDPAAMSREWWQGVQQKVQKAGLSLVAYTHFWQHRPDLAGVSMASCDRLDQVDKALAKGFRAAVVLPWDFQGRTFETPGGAKGIVCPAILAKGKIDCNSCRLCDGSKPGPVIGFPDHGPQAQGRLRKQAKQAVAEAK